PLLLDGSRHWTWHTGISQRPRRIARTHFDRRRVAFHRAHFRNRRMSISAVLLAGGASRRMGRDKATMVFRSKPLWQIQLDLLRKLAPAEILISARSDPPWRPKEMEFIADDAPSRGPLSGLAVALAKMHGSHLLALAIDMPFMNPTYLGSLCERIEPGRGVLPMIQNRAEPLAAIYPAE